MELHTLTISKAREMMKKGELTSEALTQALLETIKEKDGDIHAYREVFADALEQAKRADAIHKEKGENVYEEMPLLGIPFSIKDNITIEGRVAGASSKILENYVATYDATVISKLKKAGAIFIGRVNMDEFAMGGSTENSAYGVTKNPHDITRVSGGSSGGSAASVAMHSALASLGSDTGGSIRQPASYCGVVGLKPTYGSVSRHGLMAMGSSLDVIGPIAHTVEDTEIIFNTIKNNEAVGDRYDSTSFGQTEYEARKAEHQTGKALRVGIVPELMKQGGLAPEVSKALEETIEALKASGAEIKEINLPHIAYSLAVYYIIMPAEVSSNMSRFDGVKFGGKVEGANLLEDYLATRGDLLGKEVRRRIMLGTYVLSSGYYDAYYNKANIVRDLIAEDFANAFKEVDVILTPTAPTPAFKIGSHTADPMQMYLEDIFTVTANLIGIPAISVPRGTMTIESTEGTAGVEGTGGNVQLPIGVQFMAPHCREDLLFEAGKRVEKRD